MHKHIERDLVHAAVMEPLILHRNGRKHTYRIIVTMWKMDTKEYAPFTFTKQINAKGPYGCSKCCDNRFQLTDPNRKSFQHIRSNDHILELSGMESGKNLCPTAPSDVCKKFKDWDKDILEAGTKKWLGKKGQGYTPPVLNYINLELTSDLHYTITTDIYHASKNIFQQIFATFVKTQGYSSDKSFGLFSNIRDCLQLNWIEAKLTVEDYKPSPDFVSNISLETAPMALVESIFVY